MKALLLIFIAITIVYVIKAIIKMIIDFIKFIIPLMILVVLFFATLGYMKVESLYNDANQESLEFKESPSRDSIQYVFAE